MYGFTLAARSDVTVLSFLRPVVVNGGTSGSRLDAAEELEVQEMERGFSRCAPNENRAVA
jgi:hypothetical protein